MKSDSGDVRGAYNIFVAGRRLHEDHIPAATRLSHEARTGSYNSLGSMVISRPRTCVVLAVALLMLACATATGERCTPQRVGGTRCCRMEIIGDLSSRSPGILRFNALIEAGIVLSTIYTRFHRHVVPRTS
jgi:hypothetical protein